MGLITSPSDLDVSSISTKIEDKLLKDQREQKANSLWSTRRGYIGEFSRQDAHVCEHGVEIMPKPWTSHLIRDALGVKKCNGSMEAATEDLSLEKAIEVAKKKH
ncbi:MAG: hypothetical protein VXZ94_01925, partial [Candidatus Thermoplasmatota archaeon]|nr:hypothetical protein [Candidatus Thermoplasmatota archaeon]